VSEWPIAVTEGMLMMGIVMEVNKSIVVLGGMNIMLECTLRSMSGYLVQTWGIS